MLVQDFGLVSASSTRMGKQSLFLYRGHGRTAESVNQLLEVLPEECLVAV